MNRVPIHAASIHLMMLIFLCSIFCILGVGAESIDNDTTLISQKYDNGKLIGIYEIGPGLPPDNYVTTADLPDFSDDSTKIIDGVPVLDWSYGCAPTSASMFFGYYDRNGYPNLYIGPTNGGVFPLTNEVWGRSFEKQGQCPLSASQFGLDERTTKGHKDDYYYQSDSKNDPYYNSWDEHTPQDCLGDYMGTSQYVNWGTVDGATRFTIPLDGTPYVDPADSEIRDGNHGMRLFAESRGYSVSTNFNQGISGFNGNSKGFTYQQYKDEIDAGYPVFIIVTGHIMVGVGYSGTNQIIIHDTWDYNKHTMEWGGTYYDMQHYAVSVLHLYPSIDPTPTPTPDPSVPVNAKFSATPKSGTIPLNVSFIDLSEGLPNKWEWSFGDGFYSKNQSPTHLYMRPGKYTISLLASRDSESSYIEQSNLIHVKPPYQPVYPFPDGKGGYYPTPTDPDNDGLFEDINGNGWLEYEDPKLLFDQMLFAMKEEPIGQFDFDKSGFIGFGDVVKLYQMV